MFLIINNDLGWDNVVCIAESLEAAAFDLDCETVEELKNGGYTIKEKCVIVLPDGLSFEEAKKKYWD